MDERETMRPILRLGDSTRAGRPRRPVMIAAGLAAAGAIDAVLAAAGLARPVVLVSGFWRSGTTWAQECLAQSLGAKTIFEPLSPQEPRRRAVLARRFSGDEDMMQAFIPAPFGEEDAVWDALGAASRGLLGGAFLLSCRETVRESFRTDIVVKDVRLHRNLPAFHRRFGVPVIHVRRHPCAVAASLIAADWHWSLSRVRLAALGLPTGVSPAHDADLLSRIVALWAHVERCASIDLDGMPWARIVSYEHLVADPAAAFADLCAWLGRRRVCIPAVSRPAASVHPDVFAAKAERQDRWRTAFSIADVRRAEAIADEIFPAWRAGLMASAQL